MRAPTIILLAMAAAAGCGASAGGANSNSDGGTGASGSGGVTGTGGASGSGGAATGGVSGTGGATDSGATDAPGTGGSDAAPAPDAGPGNSTTYVYASGYADPINIFTLNSATGALTAAGMVSTGTGGEPTSIAVSPDKRVFYVCDEQKDKPASHVIAFAVNPATGGLQEINRQDTGGTTNAHVGVHPSGKWVLSANYGTGDVTFFPVRADGGLGAPMPRVPVGGQAHFILFDSTGTYLFVASLAGRLIAQFRFAEGVLTPNTPATVTTSGGPRHMTFSPDERFVYAVTQNESTILSFTFDKTTGRLTPLETVAATPSPSLAAHIAIHPNGKFLYTSNRNDNSLSIFSINATTGKLTLVGYQRDMISTPWWFSIDPTGQLMLVSNDKTATVVVNRIDQNAGTLQRIGMPVSVSMRPTFVGVVALP